jgi:putative FmdB family regulatory protein
MPIYEHRCEACGAVSEYLVRLGDEERIQCKVCGSSGMNRILYVSSFSLQSARRISVRTCCGREERCETPPCADGGT